MRVLFVCWANVGRSQMAEALYNQLTHSRDASSAGTEVEVSGETLQQRRERRGGTDVIDVMTGKGIDIRNAQCIQLRPDMLDEADLVISMAQKEYTPQWLLDHPKYHYWDVADPGGRDYAATLVAFDDIEARVKQLVGATS